MKRRHRRCRSSLVLVFLICMIASIGFPDARLQPPVVVADAVAGPALMARRTLSGTADVPARTGFASVGSFLHLRSGNSATLLPSGRVLLAGGADSNHRAVQELEVYDPATRRFSA